MRLGIVGTGFISSWLVAACQHVAGVDPVAIYSRSAQAGEAFAQANGIAQVFTDYGEMLARPDLDAVYVASPMLAHASQTIAALEAGKHVLCEKTLGLNSIEFEAIVAASQRHQRVVVEEVRPLFDPAWSTIRERLPELGAIRRVAFEKCQYSSRYDAFRAGEVLNAFNPALGNSALGDIGVYCLHPVLDLFGPPTSVAATSVLLSNGVEGSGSITLGYDGMFAELTYSKISESVRPSVIEGEDATMLIDSVAEPSTVVIKHRDGRTEDVLTNPLIGPQQNLPHALAGFRDLVTRGEVEHRRLQISRWAMQVIDQTGVVQSPSADA